MKLSPAEVEELPTRGYLVKEGLFAEEELEPLREAFTRLHRESGDEAEIPFDPSQREVLLPAGALVFFGPYTIHGAGPNRSPRPRRVLINGYAAPGANRFAYPGVGTDRTLQAGAS